MALNLVLRVRKSGKSIGLIVVLTIIQITFAAYATFFLYFMSPNIDKIGDQSSKYSTTTFASHVGQGKGIAYPRDLQHSRRDLRRILAINSSSSSHALANVVCEYEQILFEQKKSSDPKILDFKRGLFNEIMLFQQQTRGCESLDELLSLPTTKQYKTSLYGSDHPKVTVILNHFKRKTLCAQLDALLNQTLPIHNLWVVSFGSLKEESFRDIVNMYNDSRISFISSSFNFKYYGRFQIALQANEADFVYILDDDMIPGRKILQILVHIASTEKYKNSVLGSIGRILPFQQKDGTFPSYKKFGLKEAGIYLPDPVYDIVVEKMVQVDFLSSSWFLSADLVKTMFIETPFTFLTGEDLHLR